jgi:hypothetical protein
VAAFGIPGGRGPDKATKFVLPSRPLSVSPILDEDYPWQLLFQQQWISPQAIIDDEVWAPTAVSPAFDEDYWNVNQYVPHIFARAFTADDDAWPAGLQVDDDYWLINSLAPYRLVPAFISDDDAWPTGIHIDEDYLWSNRFSQYVAPLQAFRSDEDWPLQIATFGLDDDVWIINRYAGYVVPLQALRYEEEWPTALPAFGLDDDYWIIGGHRRYFAPLLAFSSDDDAWPIPVAAQLTMPNVVGVTYYQALQILQKAGIYLPLPIEGLWPSTLSVKWASSTLPGGWVSAQSIAAGLTVQPNAAITLSVSRFPFGSSIDMPPDWKQT